MLQLSICLTIIAKVRLDEGVRNVVEKELEHINVCCHLIKATEVKLQGRTESEQIPVNDLYYYSYFF